MQLTSQQHSEKQAHEWHKATGKIASLSAHPAGTPYNGV